MKQHMLLLKKDRELILGLTEREVKDNVNKTAAMVGVGYGLYLTAKWGAALFFAPETAGSSLILAGSTP